MWLRKFLELPNGIPSHDTFGHVLTLHAPGVMKEKLMEWIRSVFVKKPGRSSPGTSWDARGSSLD